MAPGGSHFPPTSGNTGVYIENPPDSVPTGVLTVSSRRKCMSIFGSLRRRDVFRLCAAIGASLTLPGCTERRSPVGGGETGAGLAVIDAHCHVFNAADLPIRGFVERVVLGNGEDQIVLGDNLIEAQAAHAGFVAVLIETLASGALSARDELREIESGALRSQSIRLDPAAQVGAALERVFRNPAGMLGGPAMQDGPPLTSAGRAILLRAMEREAGFAPNYITPQATERDYNKLAAAMLVSPSDIGRHIRWALLLTNDRRTITARLLDLYGRNRRFALFTPALVDFSHWLNDEPKSDLADQIQVMERIQRMQTGPALHCMVPFDPWRQITDRRALELVKHAIEDMGFVGIKLYPPMGFRPSGNADVRQDYPKRANAEIRDFPAKLDKGLDELYEYASEQGVPVIAHTTNTNEANTGYALRAHPDNWRSVLRKYPKLRLNLAHFGDFDEQNGGDVTPTWENAVGKLIQQFGDQIYADVGYFSELLPGAVPAEQRARLLAHLKDFVASFDPQFEHLLYGSDWVMLGRKANAERYLDVIVEAIGTVCGDATCLERFMWGNATNYLGLKAGEQNRGRLDRYYAKHQLDGAWLRVLDSLTAGTT